MPLEGDGVSDAHATGRLKDLSISVLAIDTDDFAHQWHTTDGDVAYFVLGDRTVSLDGHEVRDDTFYTTFCCHVSLIILHASPHW